MIYLYGLSEVEPEAATLDELTGVTGSVRTCKTSRGWLILGDTEASEIMPKRRHLLAHTRVLEALAAQGNVLPMRFGMIAENTDGFRELLDLNSDAIVEAFAKIEGQVECGLRIDVPREAALEAALQAHPDLARARRHLAGMKQAPHFQAADFGRQLAEALDRRRASVQKALVARLAPIFSDYRLKTPETDVQVLAADVLIPRSQQDELAHAVEAAQPDIATFAPDCDPTIRIVGPLPPFNFVTLSLDTGATEAA